MTDDVEWLLARGVRLIHRLHVYRLKVCLVDALGGILGTWLALRAIEVADPHLPRSGVLPKIWI